MRTNFIAAALLALAALPAAAQNSFWLNDSALSRMTREDTELFLKAAREALNSPDGYTSTWSNSRTGASGTVTALSSSKEKGMNCRSIETFAQAGGVRGVPTTLKACRVGQQWKLVS